MSLESTHREYIIEELSKGFLYQGIIPTAAMLEDALAEYQKSHPNLADPVSKAADFSIEHGSRASAEVMEKIKASIDQDVKMATKESYRTATNSQKFYDRWNMEMSRLEAMSTKLEQRIDSLLLLSSDTLGFFAFVGDTFVDMNSIDTEMTTASVNIMENAITINPDITSSVDSSAGSLHDLTYLTEGDVQFSPLSLRQGTDYSTTNKENALHKVFQTENSTWVGKVSTRNPGDMTCELKAAISTDKDLEVSRISMNYTGPNSTSRATVTLQYSADGYTWNLVPTEMATKSLVPRLSWTFPLTAMRWIKFIFHKPAPDNTNNEFVFASDSIKVYGQTYDNSVGNILIGKSLSAESKEGTPVLFSKASLLVCEEVPDNSTIKYYISASKNETDWTDWLAISPVSHNGIDYPKIINIGGADWKDNEVEADTIKFDATLSQKSITRTFDSVSGYRFKDTNFGTVNSAINISSGEDPTPIANSIGVWRNTRSKENYPDVKKVRDIARGWGLEGSDYYCFFEITSSQGAIIDFGDKECEIDGQTASGIVNISSGVHKFKTKSEYWEDISSSLLDLGETIGTEEALSTVDPLYPYNHKLLIEGFPYQNSFKGERKYSGTDMSAEFYCKKVSLFDLENNIDTLDSFAVRGVGNETSQTLAVILRYNNNNSDFTNELSSLRWRSGETDATMYKYVKVKAELSTEDSGISPVLSSYRVKLGL